MACKRGEFSRRVIAAIAFAAAFGFSSPLAAQPKGTVTLWVGSWWDSQVAIVQEMWRKDHPEITLNFQPLPINGYLDKFTTAALGGAPPDIIELDSTWVSTVAARDLLTSLKDVAAKLNVADIAPAAWKSSSYNGVQYAIPARAGAAVWYYNKTVFDRAKVPYPTPDWTYDDFLAIAKKLTIPGEQYGVGMPADSSDPSNVTSMFAPILWQFGGDFLTKDNSAPAINSPEAVRAIAWWSDLYLAHRVTPEGTPNFTTTRDIYPLFEANKVGLLTSTSNTLDALQKRPEVQWGIVTAPMPGRINRGGGWTMAVPAGAKNSEAAKAFLLWLARPEIQAKAVNRWPANLTALTMPPWNNPTLDPFREAERDARSVPSVAGWFQIQAAVITELQKVLVRQRTPQQAADAAAAEIKRIIAENR